MYLGSFNIDDVVTFYINSHDSSDGSVVVPDSAPTWRLYEDEAATPILTGTMTTLDSGNATGFYSDQVTLSAANGFEINKSYAIRIAVVVSSVTSAAVYTLQVKA